MVCPSPLSDLTISSPNHYDCILLIIVLYYCVLFFYYCILFHLSLASWLLFSNKSSVQCANEGLIAVGTVCRVFVYRGRRRAVSPASCLQHVAACTERCNDVVTCSANQRLLQECRYVRSVDDVHFINPIPRLPPLGRSVIKHLNTQKYLNTKSAKKYLVNLNILSKSSI